LKNQKEMGLPLTHEVRHALIKAYKIDKNYASLSRQFNIDYHTVLTLCKRFATQGETGLLPRYHLCGKKVEQEAERNYRLVRLIKSLHASWGIGYILYLLKNKYPSLSFQSERHYQRRLSGIGFYEKKTKLPVVPHFDRARIAHETWQIDAKERFKIADGCENCYLNVTDEATGSILGAKAFPPQPY
jgi:hypothetical protein